jgi:hypothetical protein
VNFEPGFMEKLAIKMPGGPGLRKAFNTAHGSEYFLDELNRTVRFKNSLGKGRGEWHNPSPAFYLNPEASESITDPTLKAVLYKNNPTGVGSSKFQPRQAYDYPSDPAKAAVAFQNRATGQMEPKGYMAHKDPKVGLSPFELYYGESNIPGELNKHYHIGNEITQMAENNALRKSASVNFEPGFLKRASIDISKIPDIMYHGSPKLFDELKNLGQGIFLAPNKGIASLFSVDRPAIRQMLGGKTNLGYKEFGLPLEELEEYLKQMHVLHGELGMPPISGESHGYVYPVDVSNIKNMLKRFREPSAAEQKNIRELVYSGESLKIGQPEQVHIPWTTEFSPERYLRELNKIKLLGMK